MMKYTLRFLTVLFLLIFPILIPQTALSANAQNATSTAETNDQKVKVVFFQRDTCQHCRAEKAFFEKLQKERSDFTVVSYRLEVPDQRKVWEKFTSRVGASKVTPITVIGDTYIVGFNKEETTGAEIIKRIDAAKKQNIVTDINKIKPGSDSLTASTCPEDGSEPCTLDPKQESPTVSLPFIGTLSLDKYPLVILSALLGFFDGFNPCAMWVLVTFLIILAQIGSRRKMFIFAGIFILAEAIMYTLILTVWYKTWDFVQLDAIVMPIVGLLAIGGGFFFLNEWRKKELECKVTNLKQRYNTRKKLEELAGNKFTFVTFLGILGIAFSVNIIEFACSIGIPQAFTKILEINQLPFAQTAAMIAIYILFYMIDDFIVFGLALYSIDKLALSKKYSKLSNLIGGIVMILLGLLLLFRPSLLFF